jgi:hypothetical protein
LPDLNDYITFHSDVYNFGKSKPDSGQIATRLIELASKYANSHRTSVMPFLFGDRLSHQYASRNFHLLESVVHIINKSFDQQDTKVKALISTADKYLKAFQDSQNDINLFSITYSEVGTDLLPYKSQASETWTGFYSSRPYLKLELRDLTRELNTSRLFYGLSLIRSGDVTMTHLATQFAETAVIM